MQFWKRPRVGLGRRQQIVGGLPSTVSHSLPLVGALDGWFPDCETSDLEVALSVSLKNTVVVPNSLR